MNARGNNWGLFGKKNTGKTHEALEWAAYFHERESAPKRILIFDHSQNSSYRDFTDVIPMERLRYRLPADAVVKVQDTDFDTFAEYVLMYVRNTVVVIDDSSAFFRGNIPDIRLRFLKSPKNNGNEYMFQCHSIRETAPLLLENIDLFVLKETRDNLREIPAKLPGRNRIIPLMEEIIEENRARESGKKWATRIYDNEDDVVWLKDVDTPVDSVIDSYSIFEANDYFNL